MKQTLDFFLHIDKHLEQAIAQNGTAIYAILFAIIFAETGLVVTPFLPGDSLLFAAGLFAASGKLNIVLLYVLLLVAAILGDTVNYAVGKFLGPRLFKNENARFLKKEHLDRTYAFYEKQGPKTIILARFVPIVRTFAPFVAGIGSMNYGKFLLYNVVGGILWVTICTFAGFFFGNIDVVRNNFSVAVLAIVAVSLLPMVFEVLNHRKAAKAAAVGSPAPGE